MLRKFSRTWVAGLGLALLLTTFASAQDAPPSDTPSADRPSQGGQGRFGGRGMGGGFGGMGGGDTLGLLGSEKVQQELELLDEQKEKLRKLADEQRGQGLGIDFQGLRDLPEEERAQKMAEVREKIQNRVKEVRGKVDEILLPHQAERLKEISLQLRGPNALTDPEVAETLKLSDEQKQQIAKVQEEARTSMRGMFGGENTDREAMRTKIDEARKETTAKMLDALTPEQQEAFTKMQGEKFELSSDDLFRSFGPRGMRGGGRRARGEGSQPTPPSGD